MGMITSSPGSITAITEAARPSMAPTVTIISSGEGEKEGEKGSNLHS